MEQDLSILSSDEDKELEPVMAGYITKAALDGIGVLESSEFQQLHQEGFFISRIVWLSTDKDVTNDKKVKFEALFKDPELCNDFAYSCKGFFPRKDDGSFNITMKSFELVEQKQMLTLIEKAARSSYQKVVEKYGGADCEQ